MITVFAEAQRLHDPPGYVVSGNRQESPERRVRVDLLMEGVQRVGSAVVAPPSLGSGALELVHDSSYLSFLETLWTRWSRVPDAGDMPAPNVHALGRATLPPASCPDSVVGQCGFYLGDGSCPVTAQTWDAACASAATALHAASLIQSGERRVYALCRPPGHHAAADMAAGFCYLNNTALAAEFLTRAGQRTAILDIDVHHGNGTEAIFYRRADVLTISIHADPKRFYPFFWGYADEEGGGEGHGFNSNIPLPRGTAIEAYRRSLGGALARITDFRPDVLILAAGLDIAVDDPFKGFAIETADFAIIARDIAALGLPILIVQEGGYPSPSLGANLASLLAGLSQ